MTPKSAERADAQDVARDDEPFMRAGAGRRRGGRSRTTTCRSGRSSSPTARSIGRGPQRARAAQDPTAHAEMLALREAAARARLLARARQHAVRDARAVRDVRRARSSSRASRAWSTARADPKAGAAGSVLDVLAEPRFNHRPVVEGGVLQAECAALLVDFFAGAAARSRGGLGAGARHAAPGRAAHGRRPRRHGDRGGARAARAASPRLPRADLDPRGRGRATAGRRGRARAAGHGDRGRARPGARVPRAVGGRGAVLRFSGELLGGRRAAGGSPPRWMLAGRGGRTVAVPPGDRPRWRRSSTRSRGGPPPARSRTPPTSSATCGHAAAVAGALVRRQPRGAPGRRDADVQLHRRFTARLEADFAAHHDAAHYADALAVRPRRSPARCSA